MTISKATIKAAAETYLTPLAVYILGLLCPMVPSIIWALVIKGVLSGDITSDHFNALLASVGLKTYTEEQPGDLTPLYPERKNSGL